MMSAIPSPLYAQGYLHHPLTLAVHVLLALAIIFFCGLTLGQAQGRLPVFRSPCTTVHVLPPSVHLRGTADSTRR